MSLETLLAAAWFVEQQDAQRDLLQTSPLNNSRELHLLECTSSEERAGDGVLSNQESPEHEDCSSSNKSASLPVILPRDKPNTSPSINNDILSNSPDNIAQAPAWTEEKEYHKRVAGTREVHNKLEKNRRAHLKECFEILKKQLPPCPDEKKSSNLSILHSALRHIQSLRRKEREFEHEMERLAREKISAQQKLAILKKELSTQWEHIDFSTLLPDSVELNEAEVKEDQGSLSTSTATEEGLDWITIQNDEDEDDDIDVISDSDDTSKLNSNTSSLSSFATPCSPMGASFAELNTESNKAASHFSIPVPAHVSADQRGKMLPVPQPLLLPDDGEASSDVISCRLKQQGKQDTDTDAQVSGQCLRCPPST
ncbi:uncharacterized protein LOC134529305 isoform X2 [Bacillus rossius redtenbacheri]|uniref:uncharacterized protein LOC134529305 isoform X2 n=1 Tax=Bacillus rossius redtenbacheri TaxID=93214 RepID=UPI002FDDF57E